MIKIHSSLYSVCIVEMKGWAPGCLAEFRIIKEIGRNGESYFDGKSVLYQVINFEYKKKVFV